MALEREPQGLGDLRTKTEDAWDREIAGGMPEGEPEADQPAGEVDEPEAEGHHPEAEDEPEARESPAAEAGGRDEGTDYEAEYLKAYGGDRSKAAKHAIEMRNQNARMARELRELKAGRQQPERGEGREVSPRQRPLEEVPAEVAQLNSTLDSMAQTYNASQDLLEADQKRLEALLEELSDVKADIDDPGPSTSIEDLQWKLRKLEKKADDLRAKVGDRDARNQALHDRYWQTTDRRNDRLEIYKLHAGERARTERDQRTEVASAREEIRTNFYKAAERAAKQLEMPDQLLQKFIGKDGYARKSALSHLVPDEDGNYPEIEDYLAFCTEAGKEFMGFGEAGHAAHSASYSRLKAADASQGVPSGGAPAKRQSKPGTPPRLPTLEDLEAEVDQRWDAEIATAGRRR